MNKKEKPAHDGKVKLRDDSKSTGADHMHPVRSSRERQRIALQRGLGLIAACSFSIC